MAKKPKTLAKLSDECATLLQRLVRLKAADDQGYCRCVTCEKVEHFSEMQGGHFVGRRILATKLMEENIHPQCRGCNCFGMKQTHYVLRYRQYMVDFYGEDFVQELESKAWTTHKYDRQELEEMKIELRERIIEQEKRLGVH